MLQRWLWKWLISVHEPRMKIRRSVSPLLPFAAGTIQFHRSPVRGMEVSFRPCFFAFMHCLPIRKAFVDDKAFERRQPMLIIMCAVIRLAAIRGGLQLIGQRSGPLLPCEMALLGEPDGKRKRLRLPRFGEYRAIGIPREAR
jgi:hypothetical protein